MVWDFEVLRNFSYSRGVRGVWSSNSETTVRPKVLGSHRDSSVPPPPEILDFLLKYDLEVIVLVLGLPKIFWGSFDIF